MNVQLLPPTTEFPITWLAQIGHVRLGADLKSGWCLRLGERTTYISGPNDMMPLLPLLEIGRERFYQHLAEVAQVQPSVAGVLHMFPDALLIRFAFETSVSDYWPLKALDWLDAHSSLSDEVVGSLTVLLQRGGISQRLRQRITATLRRAGKSTA